MSLLLFSYILKRSYRFVFYYDLRLREVRWPKQEINISPWLQKAP